MTDRIDRAVDATDSMMAARDVVAVQPVAMSAPEIDRDRSRRERGVAEQHATIDSIFEDLATEEVLAFV